MAYSLVVGALEDVSIVVEGPYTPAPIQASSMPEFSIEAPRALKVAIMSCNSPSLDKTALF